MRLDNGQQEHRGRPSTNGSSQNGSSPHTNGSARSGDANGYHSNGVSGAVVPSTAPFFGHNREEVTRILLQSLSDLGYQGAAEQLSRESGYQLEIPSVASFRNAVQVGDWDDAERLLFGSDIAESDGGVALDKTEHSSSWLKGTTSLNSSNGFARGGLPLAEGAEITSLKFLLRQQKYLELLENRDLSGALGVLRNELTPLKRDTGRLHALSALMMCQSAEDLREQAEWDGASGESRNELLSEISKSISPSVMIPEHRLATLFSAVQQEQIHECKYHNTTAAPSLYTDHECSPDDFPLQTLTELRNHTDEVWYLEFSHNGSLLATAGKDGLVTVYETSRWKVKHEFRDYDRNVQGSESRGVCYVAFSPDDHHLIICSLSNEFFVYNMLDGRLVAKADHFDYQVTAAAWLPDSQSFVVGTQSSRRPLGLYSLRSNSGSSSGVSRNNEIYSWRDPPWDSSSKEATSSFRVSDVAVSRDGTRMAAITLAENKVMVYDLPSKLKLAEWPMDDKLTSINFSEDGSLLLLSINDGKVWAMDSVTSDLVMAYEGPKQLEYVIRSSFGGPGENFVVSGSEDSCVYIWRRQTGALVATLEAHSPGTVNCVAWHPTNPSIFASAGDDRRVRIWTSANAMRAQSAEEEEALSGPAAGLFYAR